MTFTPARSFSIRAAAVVALTVVLASACQPSAGFKPVMGGSQATASQMASWFYSKGSGGFASVPVEQLAQHFIDEGAAEGVAGDLAFVQAMVETGWLRFSNRMPWYNNNFSGIGAVDGGSGSAAFPSAQIGVRAQIQHLLAYADPSANVSGLHNPLVDPRFTLVTPGIAPSWNHFGNGVWATDPSYSSKILSLHNELLAWAATHP